MQSKATTVAQYMSELPPAQRAALAAVRKLILDNLAEGFREGMQYGAIGYCVPHSLFPAGYHCDPRQPLPFAALAAQKHYLSIYLMGLYGNNERCQRFQKDWARTGKKLDMGKCCIRFRAAEDLAQDVLADYLRGITPAQYIEQYQAALSAPRTRPHGATKPTRSPHGATKPTRKSGGVKPTAKRGAPRTKRAR